MCKFGGKVESIVRSRNYKGEHRRKAVGGAVRVLTRNGRAAVWLHGERYSTRREPNHQTFARVYQNLAEHGSFRATIDNTTVNSDIDLVARISNADITTHEDARYFRTCPSIYVASRVHTRQWQQFETPSVML
ncbi:hypothetical protein TNCV_3030351 [Trichonephila clavipes]|nr:hypothetical protein TNCV_3030351 [Trichonephila clavipes]